MGSLRVKLWGTRGLISSPGQDTAIYGGNTPCVQILHKNHLIIVDTGFGCCNLGEELMERIVVNREELNIHIIYTHFHWDHIQGLPFFMPIYFTNTSLNLYSPEPKDVTHEKLDILFDGSYSPFDGLMAMPSKVKISQINQSFEIDGLRINYQAVNHGTDVGNLVEHETYSYRFENEENESIVLVTDHEGRSGLRNNEVINFAKDCNMLIHDAQFTEEEYHKHMGWGHSTARQALNNALKANAASTLLTHHHPDRTDRDILRLNRELIQEKRFNKLKFEFARELIEYEVSKASKKKVPKAG